MFNTKKKNKSQECKKTARANNGFEEIAKTKNPGAMARIFANECYK